MFDSSAWTYRNPFCLQGNIELREILNSVIEEVTNPEGQFPGFIITSSRAVAWFVQRESVSGD